MKKLGTIFLFAIPVLLVTLIASPLSAQALKVGFIGGYSLPIKSMNEYFSRSQMIGAQVIVGESQNRSMEFVVSGQYFRKYEGDAVMSELWGDGPYRQIIPLTVNVKIKIAKEPPQQDSRLFVTGGGGVYKRVGKISAGDSEAEERKSLGGSEDYIKVGNDNFFGLNAGIGAEIDLQEGVSAMIEVRYHNLFDRRRHITGEPLPVEDLRGPRKPTQLINLNIGLLFSIRD